MIFIWLIFGFIASGIFIDAVKIYKHQDNLVMIFFIVVSGFLMIYSNFIFFRRTHCRSYIISSIYNGKSW